MWTRQRIESANFEYIGHGRGPSPAFKENLARGLADIEAGQVVTRAVPIFVQFSPGMACPLSCEHCFQRSLRRKTQGMPNELARQLGDYVLEHHDRIAIVGNIDCGYILSQAPVEEVRRVTRETIRTSAPGGGYCLSSSNSIHSSVKPENFMAMIETLRECGEYPIA